jgi:hypothetical protein
MITFALMIMIAQKHERTLRALCTWYSEEKKARIIVSVRIHDGLGVLACWLSLNGGGCSEFVVFVGVVRLVVYII